MFRSGRHLRWDVRGGAETAAIGHCGRCTRPTLAGPSWDPSFTTELRYWSPLAPQGSFAGTFTSFPRRAGIKLASPLVAFTPLVLGCDSHSARGRLVIILFISRRPRSHAFDCTRPGGWLSRTARRTQMVMLALPGVYLFPARRGGFISGWLAVGGLILHRLTFR